MDGKQALSRLTNRLRSIVPAAAARPSGDGSGRPKHRKRQPWERRAAVAAAVVAAFFLIDTLATWHRVHPGVRVGGASVGGSTHDQARQKLDAVARELRERPIKFTWNGKTLSATAVELGWRPDIKATVTDAYAVGRSGLPWSIVWTRLRTWLVPRTVPWTATWDETSTDAAIARWSEIVGVPAREGRVWLTGTEVHTQDPVAGRTIDAHEVIFLATEALNGREGDLPLPIVQADPVTTPGGVAAAAGKAEEIVSAPVRVRIGKSEVTIDPRKLAGFVESKVDPEGQGPQPVIELSPKRVGAFFEPYSGDVERPAQSARFVIRRNDVNVQPSVPGKGLDPSVAARSLLAIATSEDRSGKIKLGATQPALTTEEAEKLGVTKRISSFTTYYPPGEPRVVNIHLSADILDGTIVQPGKTFSLNEALGPRTEERGFVEAPVIYDQVFTTDIGGGVSQLSTTTFNAAFFGGYPFLEYQSHSVYIDRYPMGRESTLGWPSPDLQFKNDTKNPIVIQTDYSDSSVTVEVFGHRQGRMVQATDPEITDRNNFGYTVLVHRIIEEDGEEVRKDTFTTFYRNEIETSPSPEPSPDKEPKDKQAADEGN